MQMNGLPRRREFSQKFSHDAAKRIVFLLLWSGVNVIVSRSLIKPEPFLNSYLRLSLFLFNCLMQMKNKKMRKLCINVITVLSLSLPIPIWTWRLEEVTLFFIRKFKEHFIPSVCFVCRLPEKKKLHSHRVSMQIRIIFCCCVDCDPFVCYVPKKII